VQPTIAANTLFYGDNLPIMREYIPDESIDLVYLDPPFNSNRSYSVLFRDESGKHSEAQIEAFEDTWHWSEQAEATFRNLVTESPAEVGQAIKALRELIGTNQVMAYLVMMAARLVELHRVLKPTGSLYLHCDPTASHYLKIVMDAIFGPTRFRNEIVWRRYGAHNDVGQGSKHFGRVHDTLLFYVRGDEPKWHQAYRPLDPEYVQTTYRHIEPGTGRRFTTTPMTGPGGAAKGNPVFEWNGHPGPGATARRRWSAWRRRGGCTTPGPATYGRRSTSTSRRGSPSRTCGRTYRPCPAPTPSAWTTLRRSL
jgi:hypothetical protein